MPKNGSLGFNARLDLFLATAGALLLNLLVPPNPAQAAKNFYFPSPVPVNIKPSSLEGKLFGLGFNRMNVKIDWEDNFFNRQSEKVGEFKVTSTNGAIGMIRNRSRKYSEEWDLLAGALSLGTDTKSFRSTIINKDVNVDTSGNGFNIGGRYLGGFSLVKQKFADERGIDWNLALSLHSVFYYLNSTTKADSTDLLDSNHYDSTAYGVFLRPSVAFQPIIDVGYGISVVPYVGLNSMVILGVESYEDTRFLRNGAAGKLSESTDPTATATGFETLFGFDLGLISPFSPDHKCTVGGALTQIYGSNDGSFVEYHFFYAIPFGR